MNKNDSNENEEDSSDEECTQLLRQLVSHTTAIAQPQTGDGFVWFGTGVQKRYLNARSIRLLSLQEGISLGNYDQVAGPSGRYAVMVDDLQATEPLAPAEAEQALDEVAELLNRVLRPPS